MNWDDLRIFLALARNPHLRHASKAVHLDATTISRRASRLEASLSASLFEQYGGSYRLTKRGEELFVYAEQAEAAILAAQEHDTDSSVSGRIRVSVSETLGLFIAEHIHAFYKLNPNIQVDLAASDVYRQSPSKREADIAITSERPSRGPIVIKKLFVGSAHLYASREYTGNNPELTQIEDIRSHPVVGYIPDLLSRKILDYYRDLMDDDFAPTFQCASILGQVHLVKSGVGIGILPSSIGERDPSLVRLLPDLVKIKRDVWVVIHENARRWARVRAFTDWLYGLIDENKALLCD